MRLRSRKAMLVLGSACVTVAAGLGLTAYAVSSGQEATDPGPIIDYCPTTEQIEVHLAEYGFDYKPTVVCGEDGDKVSDERGETDPADVSYDTAKQAIRTATRAPDADGDPLTVELVLADGAKKTITIFGDPKFIEGLTPAELAEVLYPANDRE
jgi:hypothetical protein